MSIIGGNALKIETVRLPREEYYLLEKEVIDKIKALGVQAIPVKAYHTKESFGDMDIIVEKNMVFYNDRLKNFLLSEFKTKEISKNGNVVSFEYKNFQIDLIMTSYENIETSQFYFNYNDIQNIIGRISHGFGLKFGWEGLYYPLRTEHGSLSSEVFLTRDPRRIYGFLDYDYDLYLQGFDTLEDIFKFVTTSRYFNPERYLKSNEDKSVIDRRREGKRKTYIEFLDWLESVYVPNNKDKEHYVFNEDKKEYRKMISDFFPDSNLLTEINSWEEYQRKLKEVSEKFNGQIVMSLFPDLKGKELGSFITSFKAYIVKTSSVGFDDTILSLTEEEIKDKLSEYYQIFKDA